MSQETSCSASLLADAAPSIFPPHKPLQKRLWKQQSKAGGEVDRERMEIRPFGKSWWGRGSRLGEGWGGGETNTLCPPGELRSPWPLGSLRHQSQPGCWHMSWFSDGLHHDYRVSLKTGFFLILLCLCQTLEKPVNTTLPPPPPPSSFLTTSFSFWHTGRHFSPHSRKDNFQCFLESSVLGKTPCLSERLLWSVTLMFCLDWVSLPLETPFSMYLSITTWRSVTISKPLSQRASAGLSYFIALRSWISGQFSGSCRGMVCLWLQFWVSWSKVLPPQSESELQAGVALPMEHPHVCLWGGNEELCPLQSWPGPGTWGSISTLKELRWQTIPSDELETRIHLFSLCVWPPSCSSSFLLSLGCCNDLLAGPQI